MDAAAYQAYRSVIESPTLRSIWATAYGERFWDEVEPPWTLSTIDDIHFVTRSLGGRARRLADLGCGSGCLARRLVQATGAHVAGIDANPMAIQAAQDRSAGPAYAGKIEFKVGDVADTGFADGAFDGAASLDVLLFVHDKVRALGEINRILKPGSGFAGTTFELRAPSPALGADAFQDYPNAFAAAGFVLEVYREAEEWRRLLEAVTAAILRLKLELSAEISPHPMARIIAWAQDRPAELSDSRRVQFFARKPF